jgi:hypothetical protein
MSVMTSRFVVFRNAICCAAFLLAIHGLYAQQTAATLVGSVADSSGAVVAEVLVRATNLATNVSRESKTDSSGNYNLPFLPAGDYNVTASITGFQTQTVDRLTLQVQQTARMDFKLTLGSINEKVTVAASADILQTENATVGTVIDSAKIVQLPLNGRNFIQLAQLARAFSPVPPAP